MHKDYAKLFSEQMAHITGIKLDFKNLWCPREYNFYNDRIYCFADRKTIAKIVRYTRKNKDDFFNYIQEKFKSCSGFISFYSNAYANWGRVSDHDPIQLMAYLEYYIINEHENIEQEIIENLSCNGHISNLLFKHSEKQLERITNIMHYLENRRIKTMTQ